MKIIMEQTAFTICNECRTARDHTIEVHSTIHFSFTQRHWKEEFYDFVDWLKASDEDFFNFHEAYLLYLNKAS